MEFQRTVNTLEGAEPAKPYVIVPPNAPSKSAQSAAIEGPPFPSAAEGKGCGLYAAKIEATLKVIQPLEHTFS